MKLKDIMIGMINSAALPPKDRLLNALNEYMVSCYKDPETLSDMQRGEVSTAFLSGILWRETEPFLKKGELLQALTSLLMPEHTDSDRGEGASR